MSQITDINQDPTKLRLVAAALELLSRERTAANLVPIVGTDKFVAIGTLAGIAKVLPEFGATDWRPYHSALSQCAELLPNMSDGDSMFDVPKFLAAHIAGTSQATKAQAEPVAWMDQASGTFYPSRKSVEKYATHPDKITPLYAAPVAKEAPAVLEGYVLAPVEPTPEMIEAANAHLRKEARAIGLTDESSLDASKAAASYYRAMLAAAPVASVAKAETAEQADEVLHHAIFNALSNHRMVRMFEVEDDGTLGNSYPLIDRLCLDDGRDTESGKDEIEALADAILDALDDELLARRFRAQGGNTITNDSGSDRAPTTSTVSAPEGDVA